MSQYVDRKEAQRSYRPVAGSMSPGLKRAREPFRIKNALLGLSLAAFAAGVWAYSISAVKQDVFDDVDEEAEALASTGTGTGLAVGVLSKAPVERQEKPPVVVDVVKVEGSMGEPEVAATVATVRTLGEEGARRVVDEVKALEGRWNGSGSWSKGGETQGVLPRLVGERFPRLLDPERKTLVWGAPSLDNLGKMSGRS